MKTYYQQLKPLVLSYLQGYQTDFTVHDKKDLRYAKKFLLAMRRTGTNLYVFEKTRLSQADKERQGLAPKNMHETEKGNVEKHRQAAKLWMMTTNERFIFGENGTIRDVSRKEAERLLETISPESIGWMYA